MEEIKVWKIVGGNEKPNAVSVEAISETTTEQLLEEVLTASPDLLMPDLHLIGRQTETPGGPLDLLGVDEDGRLVIFELKRGDLTRDAVAQALDYGSYLAGLEPDALCRHINEHSGRGGTEHIEDFSNWYQSQFQRPVVDIGRPRIMLVGLGVDDRAKRIVAFLAQSEVDISLITFHGFKQGDEILLARQVEVSSASEDSQVRSTKLGNQVKLDKLLTDLGIKQGYDALVTSIKSGLGGSAYQWPNTTGYTFSLPEMTTTGSPTNRAYIGLFAPENRKGRIQVLLQARAIEIVKEEKLQEMTKALGSAFALKPNGWGEFWVDGHKLPLNCAEMLAGLAQIIGAGWKTKREKQSSVETEELIAETADGAVAG